MNVNQSWIYIAHKRKASNALNEIGYYASSLYFLFPFSKLSSALAGMFTQVQSSIGAEC